MNNYIHDMYKKTIADIDYSKLKDKGISCLIFDLDNTIALIDEKKVSSKNKKLLDKLMGDFEVVIVSNNIKKRISDFCEPLGVPYISFAMKPFPYCFSKIRKMYKIEKKQMCIIGDQLMTDILGGNSYGIFTVLIDPLGKKDLKITTFNRYLENKIIKKLSKKNIFERGKYYD